MKRKDYEYAYDDDNDFYCFSLADSARKSRRLDCQLPQTMEEESPMVSDQEFLSESSFAGAGLVPNEAISVSPIVAKEPPSQELAMVLYNPENAATQGLIKSPRSSDFSLVINPELLSDWKSHMLHQVNQSTLTITELDEDSDDYRNFQSNNSMAVVPRATTSQQQPYVTVPDDQITPAMNMEPMEANAECEMMEFDDTPSVPSYNSYQRYPMNNGMMSGAQPPLPLQQPHCLLPQYASNTYTPIPW